MNGHCDFHTFERAVDVCGLCYGDVCRSCALGLKGRKDIVCKDCALAVSGIRGGRKPEVRGDRGTVKQRRKEYAAAGPPDDFFQFFDAEPVDAPAPETSSTSASEDPEEATAHSKPGGDQPDRAGDGSGIKRLLGRLKPDESDPMDDDFIAIGDVLGDQGDGDRDESYDEVGRDADAVSQLADIKRRGRAAVPDLSLSTEPGDSSGDGDRHPDGGEAPVYGPSWPAPSPDEPLDDHAVAIPKRMLEGLDDGSGSDLRRQAEPTALDHLLAIDERTDFAAANDTAGSSSRPAENDSVPEERRRVLQPVEQHPEPAPDPVASTPDLVSDLSGGRLPETRPGNPFLKRSRVISDPDAATDFSTDPFEGQDRRRTAYEATTDWTPVPESAHREPTPPSESKQPLPATAQYRFDAPMAPEPAADAQIDEEAAGEDDEGSSSQPMPGSTVLPTADRDSAQWTAVDDVPDLDGTTPKERADVDARGSWIPPALRGIAEDADDAGERLPRRR